MATGDDFLATYNKIDNHLRRFLDVDGNPTFSQIVNRASDSSPVVKKHKRSLLAYGSLRNAIVHDPLYPKRIIADPRPEEVKAFQDLVEAIISPKRVIPEFRSSLEVFEMDVPLVKALRYMGENDFSQVLVKKKGEHRLLTAEGVARWIEAQAKEEIISIVDTKVADAMDYEIDGTLSVVHRNCTVLEVERIFAEAIANKQPRIFAVLITEDGRADRVPLGIITPWDLLG